MNKEESIIIRPSPVVVHRKTAGSTLIKNPVDLEKAKALKAQLEGLGKSKKDVIISFIKSYALNTREAKALYKRCSEKEPNDG